MIETLLSPPEAPRVHFNKNSNNRKNSKHWWTIRIRKRQEPLFFVFSFPFPSSSMHLPFPLSPASLQNKEASVEGHVAATQKSHRWCLTLTPNNTKTIERMTCYCFLRPIRRDLTRSKQIKKRSFFSLEKRSWQRYFTVGGENFNCLWT